MSPDPRALLELARSRLATRRKRLADYAAPNWLARVAGQQDQTESLRNRVREAEAEVESLRAEVDGAGPAPAKREPKDQSQVDELYALLLEGTSGRAVLVTAIEAFEKSARLSDRATKGSGKHRRGRAYEARHNAKHGNAQLSLATQALAPFYEALTGGSWEPPGTLEVSAIPAMIGFVGDTDFAGEVRDLADGIRMALIELDELLGALATELERLTGEKVELPV